MGIEVVVCVFFYLCYRPPFLSLQTTTSIPLNRYLLSMSVGIEAVVCRDRGSGF